MNNKTKTQGSKLSINKKVIKNYSKSKNMYDFETTNPTGVPTTSSIY